MEKFAERRGDALFEVQTLRERDLHCTVLQCMIEVSNLFPGWAYP